MRSPKSKVKFVDPTGCRASPANPYFAIAHHPQLINFVGMSEKTYPGSNEWLIHACRAAGAEVLVNSHDKSSAYQLHCGLFRLVCTNVLIVSDGTFQRISIKHFGFNPDSVIQASLDLLNAVPDIMNKVQVFQDRGGAQSRS